jgi:hypothetical protein
MGRRIDSRNRVWNRVVKLHRLAGRYNNPMSTWFLALIAGLKLPTQVQVAADSDTTQNKNNKNIAK